MRPGKPTTWMRGVAVAALLASGCGGGDTSSADQSAAEAADSSAATMPAPPPPIPSVSLTSTPTSGAAGSSVSVHASGLQPSAQVELGFGGPQSDFEILVRGTADSNGEVTLSAKVPTWAEAGKEYHFTIAPVDQPPAGSSPPFAITPPGDD